MSLARYLSKLGALLNSDGKVPSGALASGAARANFGAGAVLQVVSVTKTSAFTTTSASFTTITGLAAAITPSSATSKILVLVSVTGSQQVNTNYAYIGLYRGEAQLAYGDAAGSRVLSSGQLMTGNSEWSTHMGITNLDAPATSSEVTYTVRVRTANGGTAYINRGSSDTDGGTQAGRTVSSITLMEIAG